MTLRPTPIAAALLLAACGAHTSLQASGDDAGGVMDTGAPASNLPSVPDASPGPPDDAAATYPSLMGDSSGPYNPRACQLSAVAALPGDYTLGAPTFAADSSGLVFLLSSPSAAGSLTLAAANPLGVFTTLATLSGGGVVVDSLRIDSTAAYFFATRPDATGSVVTSLESVPRGGGAETSLVVLPASDQEGIALGSTEIWFSATTSSGASAIYAASKSDAGQTLGSPAYAAPAGSTVASLFLDATTLYWVEVSVQAPDASANATILYATIGSTLAPRTFATFAAAPGLTLVEARGTVFFSSAQLPLPTPPPPGSGSESGAPYNALPAGLYAVTQDGSPVLIDPLAAPPLLAGIDDAYYASGNAIDRLTVGTDAGAKIVSLTEGLAALGVQAPDTLFYALDDGCVYEVSSFGP